MAQTQKDRALFIKYLQDRKCRAALIQQDGQEAGSACARVDGRGHCQGQELEEPQQVRGVQEEEY